MSLFYGLYSYVLLLAWLFTSCDREGHLRLQGLIESSGRFVAAVTGAV